MLQARGVSELSELRQTSLGAIILTGGGGRRLVRNKGCLRVGSVPIVERVVRALRPLTKWIVSVGDGLLPPGLELPVIPDEKPSEGPLQAICTGLRALDAELAIVVAWDMPFVSTRLLDGLVELAEGFDAVVPRLADRPEPLCAVYRRTCQLAMERAVAAGERAPKAVLDDLVVRWVEDEELAKYEKPRVLLMSVNTPEDLVEARQVVTKRARG